LASNKEKFLIPLIEYLNELNDKIHNCEICGNIDEGRVCKICLDDNRDKNTLCIVEEVGDLWAIERSKNYHGKYHVLGGNLSAISG
jgi:recombination protein RecR